VKRRKERREFDASGWKQDKILNKNVLVEVWKTEDVEWKKQWSTH